MDVSRIPNAPPVALVDRDGRVVRSTDAFRRTHGEIDVLPEAPPELDLVLTGQVESATFGLGNVSTTARAVSDSSGDRFALLAWEDATDPSPCGADSPGEDPLALLREVLDESPAITWIKDLDGRYLYVNAQYCSALETKAERLIGHADEELAPAETVDGPRLALGEEMSSEPRQLEYTVPAFEGRLPLVAWRLVVSDRGEQPLATCGIAAPAQDAAMAREETTRLLEIERWLRSDPSTRAAEVLEEWGVAPVGQGDREDPADGLAATSRHGVAGRKLDLDRLQALEAANVGLADDEGDPRLDLEHSWGQCVLALQAQAQRWREEIDKGRAALGRAQAEARADRTELEESQAECDELRAALARERERLDEVMQALGQVHARFADLDGAGAQAQARKPD